MFTDGIAVKTVMKNLIYMEITNIKDDQIKNKICILIKKSIEND